MYNLDSQIKVYLWLGKMDMRIGFDRLSEFIRKQFLKQATEGGLYVFFSRGKDRVRIFYWDGDGYATWYKRLEVGVFRIENKGGVEEITGVDLKEILKGVDFKRIKFARQVEKGLRR